MKKLLLILSFVFLAVTLIQAQDTRRTTEYWKTNKGIIPREVVREIENGKFVTWMNSPECVEKFFTLFIALKGFNKDSQVENEQTTNLAHRACSNGNITMQCIREEHNKACTSGMDCDDTDVSFGITMQAFITCGLSKN